LCARLSALSVLLAGLAVSGELPRLIVPLLARARLTAGVLATERLDLAAKTFQSVERGFRVFGSLLRTASDERLLGLMQFIAEAL
jgi:hypothetical protein